MPLFLFVLSIFSAVSPAPVAAFTPDDLQTYLSQSYEENVNLNLSLIETSRQVDELDHLIKTKPEHFRFHQQLIDITHHRNSLQTRLTKQMIGPTKLTKEEFVQIFNLISANCKAGISGDRIIIDQKLHDGSHHLGELPLESAMVKHTPRADISVHNVTKFDDPSEFILTGFSTDKRIHPWTQSANVIFKITKRLAPDRYQLASGSSVIGSFKGGSSLLWNSEGVVNLTCDNKPEIQF